MRLDLIEIATVSFAAHHHQASEMHRIPRASKICCKTSGKWREGRLMPFTLKKPVINATWIVL